MTSMYRRDLLAASGAVAITAFAGCGSSCVRGVDVTFEPVDADEIAASEAVSAFDHTPPMVTELATETLEGGQPEIETIRRGPLRWLGYVEWDGAFYEVTEETVDTGEVSGPEYELSGGREVDHAANDALAFSSLPSHDQWRLNEVADYNIERISSIGFSQSFVAGYLDAAARADSVLADGVDATVLSVGAGSGTLERLGEGSTTAHRIRYTADRVASDSIEFANRFLADRGTELPALNDSAEGLLRETKANGGRTTICLQGDDADNTNAQQRTAIDEIQRMLESPEIDGTGRQEYVHYDGTWHRIDVSEWVV